MDFNKFIKQTIEIAAESAAFKAVAMMGDQVKNTRNDGLLPKDEVAALCGGVTDMTLARWDKSGYLPKTRIGRRVFYRAEDVARIMGQKGGQA